MAICSQKPARVLTILRSSTATRRPRPGRAWTPAVFTRIGAARVVVLMRLLLPARGGSDRSSATERLPPAVVSSKKRRSRPASSAGASRRSTTSLAIARRATTSGSASTSRRSPSAGCVVRPAWSSTASSVARSSASTIVPDSVSSSARVPCAWIRPPPMMIIRSATASTSASRCEESSTVPPRSAKPRSSPRIQRMPSGSRPLAGSSRISTSGSPSSAWARPRRWRMPSEYLPTRRRAAVSSRPTSSSSVVDALRRHAHGLGGHGERLAAPAPGVLRRRVEQDPDAPAGVRQVAVAPAEDPGLAAVGLGQADEHPHRGGLAGAVGAEEARDGARLAAERDVGDDGAAAALAW